MPNADRAETRSNLGRAIVQGFAELGRLFFGARTAEAPSSEAPAPAPDPTPTVTTTQPTEEKMRKPEQSSKRAATLAARILRNGGACTQEEARVLAASVLTQAPDSGKRKAKRAKAAKA